MPTSDYIFIGGEPIEVGSHGETAFLFSSGQPVPNTGETGFVFESGYAVGAGKTYPYEIPNFYFETGDFTNWCPTAGGSAQVVSANIDYAYNGLAARLSKGHVIHDWADLPVGEYLSSRIWGGGGNADNAIAFSDEPCGEPKYKFIMYSNGGREPPAHDFAFTGPDFEYTFNRTQSLVTAPDAEDPIDIRIDREADDTLDFSINYVTDGGFFTDWLDKTITEPSIADSDLYIGASNENTYWDDDTFVGHVSASHLEGQGPGLAPNLSYEDGDLSQWQVFTNSTGGDPEADLSVAVEGDPNGVTEYELLMQNSVSSSSNDNYDDFNAAFAVHEGVRIQPGDEVSLWFDVSAGDASSIRVVFYTDLPTDDDIYANTAGYFELRTPPSGLSGSEYKLLGTGLSPIQDPEGYDWPHYTEALAHFEWSPDGTEISVDVLGDGWVYAQSTQNNSGIENADELLIGGGYEDLWESEAGDVNTNLRRFLEWQVDGYNGALDGDLSEASRNPRQNIEM